jgi:hypothetical protein
MKKPPYLVLGEQLSQDTIECLEQLLAEAKAGRVIGLAFVALRPHLQYYRHSCGKVWKYRPLVRGLAMDLVDDLREAH